MADPNVPTLAVKDVACFVRNVRTRMPFRYGVATLTAVPLLHVVATCEVEGTQRVTGVSADILPPKWFDKRPEKTYADNIADLLTSLRLATDRVVAAGRDSVFELWLATHRAVAEQADAQDLNALTASHGPSLLERAMLDALGTARGQPFHVLLRENLIGIRPGALYPELPDDALRRHLPARPLPWLRVRHTVGLSDPLTAADLAQTTIPDDGLPRTLEDYLVSTGIGMLKIKVGGTLDADLARLRTIADLLERCAGQDYAFSLDGNEQYPDVAAFADLLRAMDDTPELRHFRHHVLYVEQPVSRDHALDPSVFDGLDAAGDLPPFAIDESDGELDAFGRAAALGYRGVSCKNCKGVQKAAINTALAGHLTEQQGVHYFVTGEDLMNLPVVPLQQDLATLGALGVSHAERNGHHYVAGLAHLSETERAECLERHAPLYERWGSGGRLRVVNGAIDLASINRVAGNGVGVPVDTDAMVPLEQWSFSSLGL